MKIRNPKYPFKQCGPWENCPICFEDFSLTPCTNCGNGFEDEYIEVPSEIEQLTARVRELEEFKANVVKECASIIKHAHKDIAKQLAASQAYAEQLREALENHSGNYKLSKAECKIINDLLDKPHDTSAFDAYVSEKVKEAMK